jgi:hypothetical protein
MSPAPAPAPAPLTQEDLLRQQAAARAQEAYLNTNLLQSDDPKLKIAQDVVVGFALNHVAEKVTIDILKDSLMKSINKYECVEIPIKGQPGKTVKLGFKEVQRTIEEAAKRGEKSAIEGLKVVGRKNYNLFIKNAENVAKLVKNASKLASKEVKTATKTAIKVAVAVGEVAAEAATEGAITAATICAATGAETAGVGCLIGLAIMVIELAFDAFNAAMDIIDPNGLSVVIYKKDIELVGEMTSKWVKNDPVYNPDKKPNFLDEEIFFDYHSFMYEFDSSGNLVANAEWALKYEYYRDQYMASIGITGDWRNAISSLPISKITDPGVLDPVTLAMQEIKNEIHKRQNPTNNTLLFIIIIFVVIFLTFIILFFII